MHKSFTDLDIITKNQVSQKGEIYIDANFKPLSLNVRKAMDIVKKFEMVWPTVDQKKNIKIFGLEPQNNLFNASPFDRPGSQDSGRHNASNNQQEDDSFFGGQGSVGGSYRGGVSA